MSENNEKFTHIIPVSPCPWCKKTPRFYLDLNTVTWCPVLKCINQLCTVQPGSKYVAIRKKQKINSIIICEKIIRMISLWNANNPIPAYEGMKFDFLEIAREELKFQKK